MKEVMLRLILPVGALTLLIVGALGYPSAAVPAVPAGAAFISESAILTGLPPKAVFPFIDSTPRRIARAHIAVTDATSECKAGAAAPTNLQVLVGQAGVTLVPVLTAMTNTGISTAPQQCVFHVTVEAGAGGIPGVVTDIVVHNSGTAALTGFNTVTVSAEVR